MYKYGGNKKNYIWGFTIDLYVKWYYDKIVRTGKSYITRKFKV